jgi:hypothetical protein
LLGSCGVAANGDGGAVGCHGSVVSTAEATGTANSAAKIVAASTCAAFRAPTVSSDVFPTRMLFAFRVRDILDLPSQLRSPCATD